MERESGKSMLPKQLDDDDVYSSFCTCLLNCFESGNCNMIDLLIVNISNLQIMKNTLYFINS